MSRAVRADVADAAACRGMVGAAVDRWGRIDALVNNAGRTSVASMAGWEGLDTQAFQDIYAVNLIGAFQMIRACAPELTKAKGAIVNVSSMAGEGGMELLKSQYERAVPLERASTPGEVADAVIWLIDGAASMTGKLLLLDSGMHLGKGLSGSRPPS